MNLLVTGGAGFIGSHLVDRLLAEGHDVTVVDDFNTFYDPAIKERNVCAHLQSPQYRLVRCDISNEVALNDALSGTWDVMVHLAARAGVRPSITDPLLYQRVNVQGTHNLLELARARGTRHFVFASSSSVYGISPNVPWREDEPGLRPISPYASTKVSGELLGHVYSHLFGIRFVGLRFFTVYGPRQRPDLAIHKFARLMLDGKPLPFFGDGSTGRDYTYVEDIVAGIRAAIDYRASNYEVFNLGSDAPVLLTQLVASLEKATSTRAILDRQPDQPGDVPQTWADVSKARRLLGFQPRTKLEDGLTRFVSWLKGEQVRGKGKDKGKGTAV
jgi:UDP-glucuronate 4-epimerase